MKNKLEATTWHYSDNPVNITKVNYIRTYSNLIPNSYGNKIPVHIIHMLTPTVTPGFKMVEAPKVNQLKFTS